MPVDLKGIPMLTPSDVRMAKLKAAINRCRDGDLSAMYGIEISSADLITINALAKATGDTFGCRLSRLLLDSMKIVRKE